MNYRLSFKAKIDLQEIWNYTAESWSIEQADYYVNLLLDEMEDIAANSHRGFEQGYEGTKFLFSQVESHLIFYRRLTDNTDIKVVRVLHKKMDIPNRLFD